MAFMFRHEDYTSAWICPLEVEQTVALEMLDELHEPLSQPHTDQSVYTLGSIGGHNIAIAGLPQTANNSAVAVITQARTTFPKLRFGLLVGIGDGEPTTTDCGMIRFGDIVGRKPTGEHSGSLFVRTGASAPPPAVLLSAAQILTTQRARSKKDPILANIQRLDSSFRVLRRYLRPGEDKDYLYRARYPHIDPEVSCTQCKYDPSQRVQFAKYDDNHSVVIHRGTIGSGELVVKNGILRDALAKRYNLLCFETEAAGVMANFHCLIIRGISDYCDSHKNSHWHEYAAAAAAAYARELFVYILNDSTTF
ncbi:nucleoside phosphorylase domain-containing protein [Aspergillus californicus]